MKIYQVDSFTDRPFRGNPAGVCLLDEPRDDVWMQNVAAEMNLSETAFLYKKDHGYDLRWFTPVSEVDLCGHATLASAHILWEMNLLNTEETAHFYSNSGLLTARKKGDWITLNFPSTPPVCSEIPDELLDRLQITPKYVGKSKFDYMIEVESEAIVKDLKPDFSLLSQVLVRGIIVTGVSDHSDYDFVSRCFYPAEGIPEDPVTGSAHCCLGPYWKKRLNKDTFVAYQASKRGGVLRIKVDEDRVHLSGQAVTVFKGDLL